MVDVAPDNTFSNPRLFVRNWQVDHKSRPWAHPDALKRGPDERIWISSHPIATLLAVSPEGPFVKAINVPAATAPNPGSGRVGEICAITVDQMDAAPCAGRVLKMNWRPRPAPAAGYDAAPSDSAKL